MFNIMVPVVFGFRRMWHGVRRILQLREITFVVLPPVMINVLLFFFLGWFFLRTTQTWIDAWVGDAVVQSVLVVILTIFVVVLLMFVFLALFAALTAIIGAPFYDMLADRLMKEEEKPVESRNALKDFADSIKTEIKKLVFFGAIQLCLLLLHLLPGIGTVLYMVLGFVVTVMFLAFGYLDYAFSRTGRTFFHRIAWVMRHPFESFGFGLAVFVALLVPVLNAFMIPAAVAGGIQLYRDVEARRVTKSAARRS